MPRPEMIAVQEEHIRRILENEVGEKGKEKDKKEGSDKKESGKRESKKEEPKKEKPKLLPEQLEVLKRYDRSNKLNELKSSTRMCYLSRLRTFSQEVRRPYENVTREDVEKFISGIIDRRQSPNLYKIVIKKFFQWLSDMEDKEYPETVKWIKIKNGKSNHLLPEDLLTPKEIKMLVNAADNFRDKALIMVLQESAARVGELVNIKVGRDILFDEYGARVRLTGKTGTRQVRLVDSVPSLRTWIECHPAKDDPEAPLFISVSKQNRGEGLSEVGVRSILKSLVKRANIKKHVYCHLFRHTRLTELSRGGLSGMGLKQFAGWSDRSTQESTYIHLSSGDVDKKILEMHGIVDRKDKDEEDVLKSKVCPFCQTKCPAMNRFCMNCGREIVDMKQAEEKIAKRNAHDKVFEIMVKSLLTKGSFDLEDLKKELELQSNREIKAGIGLIN